MGTRSDDFDFDEGDDGGDRPRKRRRRDDNEDSDREPRRRRDGLSGLNIAGIILIALGFIDLMGGLAYDTTVSGSDYDRIHNIGRIATKLCMVISSAAFMLMGAIFFTHERRG